MRHGWMNSLRIHSLAAVAALVLAGGSLVAQTPAPSSGQRTDGQIEMDVVHALDASDALKNDLITAATVQGAVTLSGTVASDADSHLAESIVAKVPGVTGVSNKLRIGNPSDDPNNAGMAEDDTAPAAPSTQQPDQPDRQPAPSQPDGRRPAYPGGNQQAQNYPPQGYPQQSQGYPQPPEYPQQGYPQQAPNGPVVPGQNMPDPGQGYARPGGGGPYSQPYPQQPGYADPYSRGRFAVAPGPIAVPAGTELTVRTNAPVDEKHAQSGQPVDFTVIRDISVNGYLAIPRGATVHGVVAESKHAGQLTGSPELALAVTSLDIDGRNYPMQSDEFRVKGPSKTGRTVGNAIGGAVLGAIIGGVAGGGGGAAVGAVAGGATGTAVSAIGGPHAWIPAEALVTFHLNAPVTVAPVTQEQAARLAQGLYPGGPQLYQRTYYRPGYPPPPPGYYAYPPVYYRPYVYSGGYYYWR